MIRIFIPHKVRYRVHNNSMSGSFDVLDTERIRDLFNSSEPDIMPDVGVSFGHQNLAFAKPFSYSYKL